LWNTFIQPCFKVLLGKSQAMKICAAQVRPFKGDISKNIEVHNKMILLAAVHGADAIVFPELSLTGYEPELAKELATTIDDERLNGFQKLSNANKITICLGMPTKSEDGLLISMFIFQPKQPRLIYSKQKLHEDEFPFFINGQSKVALNIKDSIVAPAICYESLLPEHAEEASKSNASVYMTSVAKTANGVEKAYKHYPVIAQQYSMAVIMSNSIGPSDNFIGAGKSSVWNSKGNLIAALDGTKEGILIFDTQTEQAITEQFR
jgi:predicted amidohydrolase